MPAAEPQMAQVTGSAALKASGSAGYGQQSPGPRAGSPQPGWLRQRHAEQKAVSATVSAALRAWPGRGCPPVFRHVAEAFAFIDADGEGGISEFELGKGLRLLDVKNIDAAHLIEVVDPRNRGAGSLTAREFMKHFYFDNDATRDKMYQQMDGGLQTVNHLDRILREAQLKRRKILVAVNKALHQQSASDRAANEQRLAAQTNEINAAHDEQIHLLQEQLQIAGFANPSEAYCFFDCDGGKSSVVSHVDLKVGLRRLKIDHLFDLDALQWALEGGAIDAANNQRRLIMRRVLTGVKERKEQELAALAEVAEAKRAAEQPKDDARKPGHVPARRQVRSTSSGLTRKSSLVPHAAETDSHTHTQAKALHWSHEEMLGSQEAAVFGMIHNAIQQRRSLFGHAAVNIHRAFDLMDHNGDGTLDRLEFGKAMKRLDLGLTEAQLTEVVELVDANGDGALNYKEFHEQLLHPDENTGGNGTGDVGAAAAGGLQRGSVSLTGLEGGKSGRGSRVGSRASTLDIANASMMVDGTAKLPLGGSKEEKEPLRYRWFPDPSFSPSTDELPDGPGRRRPHGAKPSRSARPVSATLSRRGAGRTRPASAASRSSGSVGGGGSRAGPVLSRSFLDNSRDRPLLERSWKADFWITDQVSPGLRGQRAGWEMPARPLSADTGTIPKKAPRPRPARPQSALGARDWTDAERARAEAARTKLLRDEEGVERLQEKCIAARQEAKGRFGETDWEVFMPGKFAPQPGFNGVAMPGTQTAKKAVVEKPDRQADLQKAAEHEADAKAEVEKAQQSLELLERMGADVEEMAEARDRKRQAVVDVASYKAVAAQKMIEVLAEQAEYEAATEADFSMTMFDDPLKPPKIVIATDAPTEAETQRESRSVWVGGIPDEIIQNETCEQDPRHALQEFGTIEGMVIRPKLGKSKNGQRSGSWALVAFTKAASVLKAVKAEVAVDPDAYTDGDEVQLMVRPSDVRRELGTGGGDGHKGRLADVAASLKQQLGPEGHGVGISTTTNDTTASSTAKRAQSKARTVSRPGDKGRTTVLGRQYQVSRRQIQRLSIRSAGILENLERYGEQHPEMMRKGLEALDCLISQSPVEACEALAKAAGQLRVIKLLVRHSRIPMQLLVGNIEDREASDRARIQKMDDAKQARMDAEAVGARLAEEADKASWLWNRRIERKERGLPPEGEDEEEAALELVAMQVAGKAAEEAAERAEAEEAEEAEEQELSELSAEERAVVEREEVHSLGLEMLYRMSHKGKRPATFVGRGNDRVAEGLSHVAISVPRTVHIEIKDTMFKWDGLVGNAIAGEAALVRKLDAAQQLAAAKMTSSQMAAAAKAELEKRVADLAKEEERRAKLAAKRKAISAAREHDRREEEKRMEAKMTLDTDYTGAPLSTLNRINTHH